MRECSCDEAERNRRTPRPSSWPPAVAVSWEPNEDGEVVCPFCWGVVPQT
jgi:hypothetical protein